jgi:hypothetical protein
MAYYRDSFTFFTLLLLLLLLLLSSLFNSFNRVLVSNTQPTTGEYNNIQLNSAFTYLRASSVAKRSKIGTSKDWNKQTQTQIQRQKTKQGNLCHLDKDENSVNIIAPAIMRRGRLYCNDYAHC